MADLFKTIDEATLADKKAKIDSKVASTTQKLSQQDQDFLSTFGSPARSVSDVATDTVNALSKAVLGTGEMAYTALDLLSKYNAPAMVANKLAEQGIGQPVKGIDALVARLSEDNTGLYPNFNQSRQILDENLASEISAQERQNIQANQQRFAAQVDAETQANIEAGDNEYIAKGLGIARKFGNTVDQYLENPNQIAEMSIEQIPQLLIGGVAGKAAPKLATLGKTGDDAAAYLATEAGKKATARMAELAGVGTTVMTEALANAAQTRGEIENLSEEALQTSPEYLELRKTMSHEEARAALGEKAFNQVLGRTALVAGVTSKLTGAGKFEGNLFTGATAKSLVSSSANALREGVEETIQSGAGQAIQNVAKRDYIDPETDVLSNVGEAAGAGAVAGAALGGGLTFAASSPDVLSEVGKATAKAATKAKDAISKTQESESVKEARASGDATKVTNVDDVDYKAEDAIDTLLSPEFVPARGQEETEEAYTKRVDEYMDNLDAHLDKLEEELASTIESGNTEEASRMNQVLSTTIDAQTALFEHLSKGDINSAIEAAKRGKTEEVKESVNTVLGSMDFYDTEPVKLQELLDSGNLDETQTAAVKATIENKKAMAEVSKDIKEGSEGFLGLDDYATLINRSLVKGDKETARKYIKGLNEFAKGQYDKAVKLDEALKQAKETNNTKGISLTIGDSTYRIHKGSGNFVNTVKRDYNAINTVLNNFANQYRNKPVEVAEPVTPKTQPKPQPKVEVPAQPQPEVVSSSVQSLQTPPAKAVTSASQKEVKEAPKPKAIKPMEKFKTVGDTALYLRSKGKLGSELLEDRRTGTASIDIISKGINESEVSLYVSQRAQNNLISKEGDLNEAIARNPEIDYEIAETVRTVVPKIKDELKRNLNNVVDTSKTDYLKSNLAQLLTERSTNNLGNDLNDRVMDSITYSTLEHLSKNGTAFTRPDGTQMKRLLGLDSKDQLTSRTAALIKGNPVLAYEMMGSIGKTVANSLGLKAKKDTNRATQSALETGLGQLAYLALIEQGVLEEVQIKGKDLLDTLDSGSFSTKFKEQNTYAFVKVANQERFDELFDISKQLGRSYDVILGNEASRAYPSLKPSKAPDTTTVNNQRISKEQTEAINKYNNQKYFFNEPLMNSLDVLGKDFIRDIEGFNRDLDSLHVLDREAQEVINNGIDKQIDELNTLRTINKDNKAMYFNSVVDIQNRIRIDNTLVNPQSYKIQRHLLQMEAWKSTIDTKAQRDIYKLALGQAFGLDIDKQSNRATTEVIDYVLAGNNEVSQLLFKAASYLANTTEANKAEALDTLNKAMSKHSFDIDGTIRTIELHGTHALAALYAMSNYEADKPFESSVFLEVDGITNGTAIGLLQLAPFADFETALEYLEKTGMYSDGYRSYGQFKEAGNTDNYEALAAAMQEIVADVTAWDSGIAENATPLQAVGNILGSIGEVNDLTLGLIRKIAKNPVMTGNYGAGVTKIITGLENEVIAKLYSHIMKGVNNKDQKYLDMLQSQLSKAIGYAPQPLTVANGKEWVLSKRDEEALRTTVQTTLGAIMSEALDKTFKPLMDKRTELNQILEVGNVAFKAVYDYERAKITTETGTFTTEQEQELLARINRIIPKVAHAKSDTMKPRLQVLRESITAKNVKVKLSELKSTIDDIYDTKAYNKASNLVKALEKELDTITLKVTDLKELTASIEAIAGNSYDISTAIQVADKEAVVSSKNVGSKVTTKLKKGAKKSKNTTPPVLEFADSLGVRPAVMLIQSIDSANMVDYMGSTANGMNIYDAIITGVNDAALGTNALNKGMYNNNFNYSIFKESVAYTDRALAYFNANYGNVKDTRLDKARAELAKNKLASKTSRDAILKNVQANRKTMKDNLEYIDQYYLQGAGYRTEVGKKEVKPTIEETVSEFVRANVDDILGSTDANTAFNGNYTEFDIKASNIGSLLDMLRGVSGVASSESHYTHLKSLLEKTYNSAIYPLKLQLFNSDERTAGMYDEANELVKINANRVNPKTSMDMSAEEVLAHEVVHAITKNALLTNGVVSAAIQRLFRKAKKVIKPSDLKTDSMTNQEAKDRWNYIFNNPKKVSGTDYSVGMLEFVAFGLTNEKLKNALSAKTPIVGFDVAQDSFLEKTVMLFERVLNSLYAAFGRKRFNPKLKGLPELVQELVRIETKAKQRAYDASIMTKLDKKVASAAKAFVLEPLTKFAESPFIANNRFNTVQALGTITSLTAKGGLAEFKKVLNKVMYRLGLTENNLLVSMVNEIAGRSDDISWAMELNRKSKRMIDQIRGDIAHNTQKILANKFSRKLTVEEETAITKMLLRTDIQSLYGNYDNEAIVRFLTDSKALDAELKNLEARMKNEFPKESSYYILQSKSLANFLVTSRYTESVALQNSHLIANLALTNKVFTGNSERAEQLIDSYTSLLAYKQSRATDAEMTKALDKVMSDELKVSTDDNGISFAILTHKHFIDKSLKESFNGNKTQTVKGYVKEIFNPAISFKVAPISEKDALEVQGYEFKGYLAKDIDDSTVNAPKMAIFVNESAGLDTWQAGGINLTDLHAKGAEYFEVLAQTGLYDSPSAGAALLTNNVTRAKVSKGNQIYNGRSTSKGVKNTLVPIFDELMNVTGYRYLMTEANKDELLERDNRFSHVLGATEGNFISKTNSVTVNKEYINAIYADFKDNYTKDKDLYVFIGENSKEAEYKELYKMLPYEAKQEVERLFKTKGLFIKRDVVKIAFGQRKFSLTSYSRAKAKLIEQNDKVLNAFMLPLWKILGSRAASKAAKSWVDLIKLVKDVIVIRSGVTLIGNVASNNLLLWTMGVPYNVIGSRQLEAVKFAEEYEADNNRVLSINVEIDALMNKNITPTRRDLAQVRRLEAERTELEDALARNPVTPLIRAGIYQSIIEDTEDLDSVFVKSNPLDTFIKGAESRIPERSRNVINQLLISPETKAYKFLRRATQLSDFAARYALHLHNLEQGMDNEQSLNKIEDVFINYDLPTHKSIQYMNDIGAVMFTKFFMRIQRVIWEAFKERPARMLSLLTLQDFLNINLSDISDSNPITKDLGMMFNTSPVDAVDGIITAHPIYAATN